MEGWGGIPLTAVSSTGNLKQLYPTWAPTGVNPASATTGQLIRKAVGGTLGSAQVQTDNTNGGIIEIWDVNGADAGADVSSSDVITDTQLTALVSLGKAKLIYSQNFTSTAGATSAWSLGKGFMHGLAARFVQSGPTGACKLNVDVGGGFYLTNSAGV